MFGSAFGIGQWIVVLATLAVFFALLKGMVKTVKRKPIFAPFCMILLSPLWVIWSIVELFTGEIEPGVKTTKTEKMKYIGVWLLAVFVIKILDAIIATFIFSEATFRNINSMNDVYFFIIVASILYVAIHIGVFVIIYNSFISLNMKKVFPYLVVLSGLGTMRAIGEGGQDFTSPSNFTSPSMDTELMMAFLMFLFFFSSAFFITIFTIRKYYISKPDRWY